MKQTIEYKSVAELCAEHHNLYEYVHQLEQRLKDYEDFHRKYNPCIKFKTNQPDGLVLTLMFLGLCLIPFFMMLLNSVHKENIENLKNKPVDNKEIKSNEYH